MKRLSHMIAIFSVLALVAAACGGDDGGGGGGGGEPTGPAKTYSSIGETEGALDLVAWAGYVEDGTTEGGEDFDWVNPFTDATGCEVTVKYADSSDEMVTLMRQGGGTAYDGVSASGDASNRLIAGGDVGAVDTSLFTDLAHVIPPLNPDTGDQTDHYVVGDYVYGVPYMYGPNFLMYNTDVVTPAPTSWDVVFEPDTPYAGKLTGYDVPIYIADAAMYLKAHQPDLGITDPYELTQEQLDASVNLLKGMAPNVSKFWSLYTDEIDGFTDGSMVAGTAWPINLSLLELDSQPVAASEPSEGMTGWADTWMISANAQHPNCMLEWMKWTLTAEVQSEVAYWYGAAASNVEACPLLREALGDYADQVDSVRYGYCGSEDFLKSIYFWKTPQAECGDDRGSVCMDYSVWQQKWTEIRGA